MTISIPHKELHRVPANLDGFWVVTVLSNPIRYKRRYELYWRFKEMCQQAGVKLITVEQAFGLRPFMVTSADDPFALQVRSVEELWHKENMINMGIRHASVVAQRLGLSPVREVAWIDADCRSTRPPRDWFEETWHQLQHYEFVQMWEWIIDLDVNYNPVGTPNPSFMSNYVKYGTPYPAGVGTNAGQPYSITNPPQWGSPGLAWGANVDALNKIGMIPDYAILGAGDWYLAHMLISGLDLKEMTNYSPGYRSKFAAQQELCGRWIKKDVGYVSGWVYHDWHGKKANRGYNTREKILIEHQYDPHTDIKYDANGMLQLETWDDRQIQLRDKIRAYFRARNEDSIDL
jgi:hypothetical protein